MHVDFCHHPDSQRVAVLVFFVSAVWASYRARTQRFFFDAWRWVSSVISWWNVVHSLHCHLTIRMYLYRSDNVFTLEYRLRYLKRFTLTNRWWCVALPSISYASNTGCLPGGPVGQRFLIEPRIDECIHIWTGGVCRLPEPFQAYQLPRVEPRQYKRGVITPSCDLFSLIMCRRNP